MPKTNLPVLTAASVKSRRIAAGSRDVPTLRLRAAIPAAAVAGVTLDLATPDVGWWPFAFVSVALALATLVGRSIAGALVVGLIFGASFYTLHLSWVGHFLGPLPRIALSGLETLLFAVGAVPIMLAFRWTSRYPLKGPVQTLVVPLLVAGLWTTRELMMGSWPYSGFPWVRLGMTQVNGPFPEVASWIGVTGLSFLVAIVSASVLQWLRNGGVSFLRGLLPAGIVAGALLVTPQFPTTDAGTLTVGWVQGNGPSGYFDAKQPGDVLAAHSAATATLINQDMDLLVWPEGAVDSDPFRDRATAAELDRIVELVGAPLLANAATTRGDDTFNTTMLWTAERAERQLHDKMNPVPFGEYVPDRWLYERIAPDLVGLIQREYTPGSNAPLVRVGDVPVGLAICFDVIFDDVIRSGAQAGAQLYVFQTNNADFRDTDENLQQLAFARMRAIETGRAVINVSTVGTSQVISPTGDTVDAINVDTAAAKVTTVPLRTRLTAGVVIGPWLSSLITITALAVVSVFGLTHRRFQPGLRPEQPRRSTVL
ncbi:apolipoprotein N-acyltransferase [Microbacterium esteraromaticum]|uniref:apolipoprotein N-acyltransferase n=1 Tax=Microbacterium esteraromaticum TaxID=57043 RepID=UPI001A8D8514|nr:apolipoprotein N-acyltransferase [Microbacterium esteraromaticum]MBN8424383.1 apolipoprotein N-acyltransferase [Microbacterium esteraromaticum]